MEHSYWVYDRYEIIGTELVPVRTNDWPVWIWHTYKENQRNTSHFTRAEKDEMWGDRSVIKTATLGLDEIFMPPASWSPRLSAEPKLAAPNLKGIYDHVVYSGETLEGIARQYSADTNVIMKLNGITNPATVKLGVKLLVPIPD